MRKGIVYRLQAHTIALYLNVKDIKINIQSARIGPGQHGKYQITLVMPTLPDVNVLRRILGTEPALTYFYDGTDITFYLIVLLNQSNKKISIPVNASAGTLKWLALIDQQLVDYILLAHFDGKGGLIRHKETIKITNEP